MSKLPRINKNINFLKRDLISKQESINKNNKIIKLKIQNIVY